MESGVGQIIQASEADAAGPNAPTASGEGQEDLMPEVSEAVPPKNSQQLSEMEVVCPCGQDRPNTKQNAGLDRYKDSRDQQAEIHKDRGHGVEDTAGAEEAGHQDDDGLLS